MASSFRQIQVPFLALNKGPTFPYTKEQAFVSLLLFFFASHKPTTGKFCFIWIHHCLFIILFEMCDRFSMCHPAGKQWWAGELTNALQWSQMASFHKKPLKDSLLHRGFCISFGVQDSPELCNCILIHLPKHHGSVYHSIFHLITPPLIRKKHETTQWVRPSSFVQKWSQ